MSSSIFCRRGALGCSRAHFNPRTPYGVRPGRGAVHLHGHLQHFNPRTPCGVRPCQVHLPLCPQHISIHAPLTGCDVGCRSPPYQSFLFQSTHPSRGATWRTGTPLPGILDFNPRTPRGVRRPWLWSWPITWPNFNPRTPCGVRRRLPQPSVSIVFISIHAPLAGCPFFPGGIPTPRRRRTHPVSGKKCAYPG